MKTLTIIFLVSLLFISMLTCALTAEAKSKTFKVSCVVPANLELSSSLSDSITSSPAAEQGEERIIKQTPSTIQTQETRIRGNQKAIIYTIIER